MPEACSYKHNPKGMTGDYEISSRVTDVFCDSRVRSLDLITVKDNYSILEFPVFNVLELHVWMIISRREFRAGK